MKTEIPIYKMSQKQLKTKIVELKGMWERTSTYGSPWGTTSTKAELYDLEKEMESVSRLIERDVVKANPMKTRKDLDEIYDGIDALMRAKCWNFLDALFICWEMKIWRTDIDILLAYATASFPGKGKLPSRKLFMNTCLRLHPDSELWKNLI